MASDIPVRGTAAYAANLFIFFVSSPSRVFVFSPWGIMPINRLQQPCFPVPVPPAVLSKSRWP